MTPPGTRAVLLAASLMVTLGFLGRAFLAPAPLERPLPAFRFPSQPLPGWGAVETGDPSHAVYRKGPVEAAFCFIPDIHLYHRSESDLVTRMPPAGDIPLDAGLHFFADATGRVKSNEKGVMVPMRPLEIRRESEGFHGLWDDGARFHLVSILGANGRSAATSREVLLNVFLPQFNPRQVARWVLAEGRLPDKRCILADIRIPISAGGEEEGRRALEQAWTEWRGWLAAAQRAR